MKYLLLTLIVIIFYSCKEKRFLTENVKYAAYTWNYNDSTSKYDFYLSHFIEIYKDGHYSLIKHDVWRGKIAYFKGQIDDSIFQIIDTICLKNTYKQKISISDIADTNDIIMYCGLSYCLDYKLKGNKNTSIQFIQYKNKYPEKILNLGKILDSFIFENRHQYSKSFEVGYFIDNLKKMTSFNLPPPPSLPPTPPNMTLPSFK